MRRRLMLGGTAMIAALTVVVLAAGADAYAGPFARSAGMASVLRPWAAFNLKSARPPIDTLTSVSCTSASFCMTVGISHINPLGAGHSLAEAWNGRMWRVQKTPTLAGSSGLSGVSCTRATRCMAVGFASSGRSLAEAWNGKTWRMLETPKVAGGSLSAVSCTRAARCIAVGSDSTCELAEAWNGSTWKVLATPSPCGPPGLGLSGVACRSATTCMASGSYVPDNTEQLTLAEAWNGRRWRQLSTESPGNLAGLSGVSCLAAAKCMAVGVGLPVELLGLTTLAEAWNGHTWRVVATPSPGNPAKLSGVSCPKPSSCMAVGSYTTAAHAMLALAERWNGSTWSVVLATGPGRELTSVSCTRVAACIAVGQTTTQRTLAERWNGARWQVLSTPNP